MAEWRPDPLQVAAVIAAERYPDALCIIAAGSFQRGEAMSTSDIDLFVVIPDGDAPYRESFVAHGWPVEAFVHTPTSYRRWFVSDGDRGRPSLCTMCLEGAVIADRGGLAEGIRREAEEIVWRGPARLSREEIEDRRYGLTDLLDDFIGAERRDEALFTAILAAQHAADLMLLLDGKWIGSGKWVPRALGRADPEARQRLAAALDAYALRGEKDRLIAFIREVLDRAGGPLFDGYRRSGRGPDDEGQG